ncbi:hypothetical protein F0562_023643 [Nyssa sinensis]|uniref:Retrotransposon Copia-like N-terminal domain-containing protein n=1 Tax=Nyssa sinensis TaxID=561372 RepID=A0A5J5BIF1_9ASTE|nr:hypothetical protein F0562_023643 [Nyssa sinensis]
MASCNSSSSSQYPHPSIINVGNFVSVKLTTANYLMWEAQMLSLILSQNLQGFIDGQNEAPPQNITVQPHDGSELNAEIENPEYPAWTRTDWLLKGWIIGSLSEEILGQLVLLTDWKSYTARDLWTKLAITLAPHSDQKPEIQSEMDEMIASHSDQKPEIQSPTDENTKTEEYVEVLAELMNAIYRRERFSVLKNLIELMSPEELVWQEQGLTALNAAAGVGNIQVANLQVEKAPFLPYIKNPDDSLPIHVTASFGHREMTSYLMKVTKDDEEAKPFEDLNQVLDFWFGHCHQILRRQFYTEPVVPHLKPSQLYASGSEENLLSSASHTPLAELRPII